MFGFHHMDSGLEIKDDEMPQSSVNVPDPDKKCWICLETESESSSRIFSQGCACRGQSQLHCHLKCIADHASQKECNLILNSRKYVDPWLVCSICSQHFTGRLRFELSNEHYDRCRELDWNKKIDYLKLRSAARHVGWASYTHGRPEKGLSCLKNLYDIELTKLSSGGHEDWLKGSDFAYTCFLLGKCLLHTRQVEEAVSKFDEGLLFIRKNDELKKRNNGTMVEAYLLNGLADVHSKQGNFSKAVEFQRREVTIMEDIRGRNSIHYLMSCLNLARALSKNDSVNEAVKLARSAKKDAIRLLGANHSLVLNYNDFLLSCSSKSPSENQCTSFKKVLIPSWLLKRMHIKNAERHNQTK